MSRLISVIMPAYNSQKYISEAIDSVLCQDHKNLELIVVNDGSTDDTKNTVLSFRDSRIKYLEQDNRGVSEARNLALSKMTGDYFCFLDADDFFPVNSLSSRLEVFEERKDLSFVDGVVVYTDEELKPIGKKYIPQFKGDPYNELLKLNSACLFGNTWMVKKESGVDYKFNSSMTHAEDLYFYLTISKNKLYDFTTETILHYRKSKGSAMSNLLGLEEGYIKLIRNIKTHLSWEAKQIVFLKLKVSKIMFLSHLFDGRSPFLAFRAPFKILFS